MNVPVRNEFDNEENLKKLYPEYAHILINKADEVKKEIFLHNNKPLVDFLSTHYRYDFQKAKFFGMERFFEVHKNDFKEERYCLASQQKNYSSCIIKSKNTSDCVTVHRLQLVNMLNGLEAFFDFKLQSTS